MDNNLLSDELMEHYAKLAVYYEEVYINGNKRIQTDADKRSENS